MLFIGVIYPIDLCNFHYVFHLHLKEKNSIRTCKRLKKPMMMNLDFKSMHCVLEVGGLYGNSQLKTMLRNMDVMVA